MKATGQAARGKRAPQRRCLGCGRRGDKATFGRFVAAVAVTGEGEPAARRLVRDDRARLPGRGLYVCHGGECFQRALARRAFARGARLGATELRIDPDASATLVSER